MYKFKLILIIMSFCVVNFISSAEIEEKKVLLYPMNLPLEMGKLVKKIKWSTDGLKLAIAMEQSNKLNIWDPHNNKLLKSIEFGFNINTIAWSADNNYLAVCLQNNSLIILKNNKEFEHLTTLSIQTNQQMVISEIIWSNDSRYIATASSALYLNNNILILGNKTYIHFWDFATSSVIRTKEFLGNFGSMKFSNENILAVTTTVREKDNTIDDSDLVSILLKGDLDANTHEESRIYLFNPYDESSFNFQINLNHKIQDFIWLSSGLGFITKDVFGKINSYDIFGKCLSSVNLNSALIEELSISADDQYLAYVEKNYLNIIKLFQDSENPDKLLHLKLIEMKAASLHGKAIWSTTHPLIAAANNDMDMALKLQILEVSLLFENFKTLKKREMGIN